MSGILLSACSCYYLVLHPEHKLEYFKEAGWSQEWIDTAVEIVRDEWLRKWKKYSPEDMDGSEIEEVAAPSVRSNSSRIRTLTDISITILDYW